MNVFIFELPVESPGEDFSLISKSLALPVNINRMVNLNPFFIIKLFNIIIFTRLAEDWFRNRIPKKWSRPLSVGHILQIWWDRTIRT